MNIINICSLAAFLVKELVEVSFLHTLSYYVRNNIWCIARPGEIVDEWWYVIKFFLNLVCVKVDNDNTTSILFFSNLKVEK